MLDEYIDGIKDQPLVIPENMVEIKECIGYGYSAKVYKAILREPFNHIFQYYVVAVKEILKFDKKIDDFNKELCGVVKNLRVLKHPNVIKFITICERLNKTNLIVMEYARGGCLDHFLYFESDFSLTKSIFFGWTLQIIEGMIYLHDNDLLHADLKTKNILLNFQPENHNEAERVVLKLANFTYLSPKSTASYMAPEMMKNQTNKKSDVWSFGVVLWELLHRERPFDGMESHQILYKVGSKKEILPISDKIDDGLSDVFKKCVSYNHEDRPNFEQVKNILLSIKDLNFKNFKI